MEDKKHSITLEDRGSLSISGVKDIYNFDENKVALETSLGTLTVTGEGLQINKLSIDDGNLQVKGNITSCIYSEGRELKDKGKGILARMFK
ncbi:MAG: sporulation protein YabP [Bacillota bacterium]|nr:sporulation protein YabP [Bacillota bacterium]MDD3298095.1 sporulation protein YabP [Bacillota bacterium]MDD3850282.1 sporulation protein YabP [Bacillota bacterium]MDD4707624.1 sporulation protein YabP [Bacillota bacterium]